MGRSIPPRCLGRGARFLPALERRLRNLVLRQRLVVASLRERNGAPEDRKSTRLNSSHGYISYAVFCLKKKKLKHAHAHYVLRCCHLNHLHPPPLLPDTEHSRQRQTCPTSIDHDDQPPHCPHLHPARQP